MKTPEMKFGQVVQWSINMPARRSIPSHRLDIKLMYVGGDRLVVLHDPDTSPDQWKTGFLTEAFQQKTEFVLVEDVP